MNEAEWLAFGPLFKPHPWHGVPIGDSAPEVVTAYIEIVHTDSVKYEIDKTSGYLRVDRPQQFSNVCPALYGFIPQTLCGKRVARRPGLDDKEVTRGDNDPMDICVYSESSIPRGDILLDAIPIGGFRMLDKGVSDEKIIAVLRGDAVYGQWGDITDFPASVLDRLSHYFLTYKHVPGEERTQEIAGTYGRDEAHEVIRRSQEDYQEQFSELSEMLARLRS